MVGARIRVRLLILAAFVLSGGAPFLRAHLLNMTYATVEVDQTGAVSLELRVDLLQEFGSADAYFAFAQQGGADALTAQAHRWNRLADSIDLRADAARVELQVVAIEPPGDATLADFESPFKWPRTTVRFRGQVDPDSQELHLTFRPGFTFEEPIAVTLASAVTGKNRSRWIVTHQPSPRLVWRAESSPMAPATTRASAAESIAWYESVPHYIGLGFRHLLPGGVDHLLFVAGLFLAARSWMALAGQISIFTLAHTLTLGLASLRIIEPPDRAVEVLIAASIAYIGFENLRSNEPGKTRYALIAGFGLLHGMGFARALVATDHAAGGFWGALVGFNVGVELGQLAFVALLVAVLGPWRSRSWYQKWIAVPASIGIAFIALFWVVQRLLA